MNEEAKLRSAWREDKAGWVADLANAVAERDRYREAIKWVIARNTSGVVLGGYDKPMVEHLLEALDVKGPVRVEDHTQACIEYAIQFHAATGGDADCVCLASRWSRRA